MPGTELTSNPPDALRKLSAGLLEYQRVSGRTSAAILVQKGGQLLYGNQDTRFGATFPGLIQLFLAQAPHAGAITAAAQGRGFRLGALSEEAKKRARFWMGGFKSILARPTVGEQGRLSLGAVRIGARGRRILGGRKGRAGGAVSGGGVGRIGGVLVRAADEKRLNFQAVATLMEINLRESGRRFLASSFLFQRWKRLAASDPKRDDQTWRQLVNNNPRSFVHPLGTAGLEGDEPSGNLALRITSFVPGVGEIGESRGLFAKAVAGILADIATYVARKQAELMESELRRALSA